MAKRQCFARPSEPLFVQIKPSFARYHGYLSTIHTDAITAYIHTKQKKLEDFDDSGITIDQKKLITLLLDQRKLTVVVGEAGTGKTFIQSTLMKICKKSFFPIIRLGPTHACLQNMMGSMTFQFFFGLVDKKYLDPSYAKISVFEVVKKIARHNFIHWSLKYPGQSTIIIDEAFMIPAQLIDIAINALEQIAPGKFRVFLFFDPLQLGPVMDEKNNPHPPQIILHSQYVKDANVFVLNTNMRQTQEEKEFLQLLRQIARGSVDDEIYTMLKSRIPVQKDTLKVDLHICATNDAVKSLNKKHLEDLKTQIYTFAAFDQENVQGAKLPATLSWAVGAKIIFDASLNDVGLYNGMTGTIVATVKTDTDLFLPVVEIPTYDNMQIVVHPYNEIITNDSGTATKGTRMQFPFAIAHAITVHKVQGKTITGSVLVHLENMFTNGQIYTSISRVTKFSNLWILNLPQPKIGYSGLYNLNVSEESIKWAHQVGMITL